MPKSRTKRSPEQEREHGEKLCREFNERHPVGSTVWYWMSLPFGPVKETTVRREACLIAEGNSNAGTPVVFLAGIGGYVSAFHIKTVDEARRADVNPTVLHSV